MKENRLSRSRQAKRRDSSQQGDLPAPPRVQDSHASTLEFCSWTMTDMLASEPDDCVSEALPQAKKRTPTLVTARSESPQFVTSSFLADRIQTSIDNLQVFYRKLATIVGVEGQNHGRSEAPTNPDKGSSHETCSPQSTRSDDLKDLLSSLHVLLSVLKRDEELQTAFRARTQALREQKEALRREKRRHREEQKRFLDE